MDLGTIRSVLGRSGPISLNDSDVRVLATTGGSTSYADGQSIIDVGQFYNKAVQCLFINGNETSGSTLFNWNTFFWSGKYDSWGNPMQYIQGRTMTKMTVNPGVTVGSYFPEGFGYSYGTGKYPTIFVSNDPNGMGTSRSLIVNYGKIQGGGGSGGSTGGSTPNYAGRPGGAAIGYNVNPVYIDNNTDYGNHNNDAKIYAGAGGGGAAVYTGGGGGGGITGGYGGTGYDGSYLGAGGGDLNGGNGAFYLTFDRAGNGGSISESTSTVTAGGPGIYYGIAIGAGGAAGYCTYNLGGGSIYWMGLGKRIGTIG
jgi:hypothetical protein